MATRRCWHCDTVAHMTRISDGRWIRGDNGELLVQGVYFCDQCAWIQFVTGPAQAPPKNDGAHANMALAQMLEHERTWWPQVGVARYFEDVPPHIAEAASEAHRCFSIQAYRATASLARAVVEATAKEKGITTGQIKSKIDKLHSEGHIREHVKDVAHEIRYLGNEAAHGDFVDPLSTEEAAELLELMAEVLQEVFQSPARVERMRAAREARRADTDGDS